MSQYGSGQALEGFLVPTLKNIPNTPNAIGIFKAFLPASKIVLALIIKIVTALVSVFGIFFIGIVLCTFTTICNTRLPPLTQLSMETKEIVNKIGEELTAERIKRAADIFSIAFNKYHEIQKMQN